MSHNHHRRRRASHLRGFQSRHHGESEALKAARATALRIEKTTQHYAAKWTVGIQQVLATAEKDIGLPRGYIHALLRAENPAGDSNAAGMSHATKHHKSHAVSHGLLQLTADTMMIVAERHSKFLTAHGFPHVDASMIHNPQLNAYIGGLLFKDLGATKDPARAYLRYVSPKMATAIFKTEQDGNTDITAAQLAAQNGIPSAVVLNNPAVYGPKGNWTIAHVLQHNLDKFSGVMPAALITADTPAPAPAPAPATAAAAQPTPTTDTAAATPDTNKDRRLHRQHRLSIPTTDTTPATPQATPAGAPLTNITIGINTPSVGPSTSAPTM